MDYVRKVETVELTLPTTPVDIDTFIVRSINTLLNHDTTIKYITEKVVYDDSGTIDTKKTLESIDIEEFDEPDTSSLHNFFTVVYLKLDSISIKCWMLVLTQLEKLACAYFVLIGLRESESWRSIWEIQKSDKKIRYEMFTIIQKIQDVQTMEEFKEFKRDRESLRETMSENPIVKLSDDMDKYKSEAIIEYGKKEKDPLPILKKYTSTPTKKDMGWYDTLRSLIP
jgi:hypothetical protein